MARQLAGQVHLRAGRLVPAERNFLEAIEADRLQGNPAVVSRRELIYIYGIQLRRRELREVFEGLSEVAPMTFGNVFHWCLTRGNDWEPQEIVDDMTRFLNADPSDRWSRIALARSLARLSRLDDAWNAIALLSDDDPDAIALRAQIAYDRGDSELAIALLEMGPQEHFDLSVLRARAALSSGDLEKARQHFGIALKIDPDNRDAVVGMARVLSSLNLTEEAKSWQERAAKLDKLASLVQKAARPEAENDSNLVRSLAESCESVGHSKEARAWWRLLAAKDPLDHDAQSALYRLGRQTQQIP